jgi:hypothetical protein
MRRATARCLGDSTVTGGSDVAEPCPSAVWVKPAAGKPANSAPASSATIETLFQPVISNATPAFVESDFPNVASKR